MTHVTFFKDRSAQTLTAQDITLEQLRDLYLTTSAQEKAQLPWNKLARFGDVKSDKGSLRYNGNVKAITGVEGDYDLEIISFAEAVETVQRAKLQAIIFTSPSHTPLKPRWRIQLPTSKELEPNQRAPLLARVNGIFGGVFSIESFTLSQAYYYGCVNDNPEHQVAIVQGDFIDNRADLDATALGKASVIDKTPDAVLMEKIRTGTAYHPALVALSARLIGRGESAEDAIDQLRKLFDNATGPHDARWQKRLDSIPGIVASAVAKFGRGPAAVVGAVSLEDFRAYMPMHNYIFTPSGEPWPAASVNARVPPIPDGYDDKGKKQWMAANVWLDRNKPVEQMTWAPGLPMLICDRLVANGGWIERTGVTCLNLYRPPRIELGDPTQVRPWLRHLLKVWNKADAKHIVKWCAYRVQHPEIKINHALVIGSLDQGIGKDTAFEPLKYAVGPWNFQEVSPQQLIGRFNGFLKSVILRVNEARDLGEVNRYGFYEHTKAYNAVPPDTLLVDEKNLREHSVFNCCGLIISTNHKTNGIYLPPDDRRHYVAWSDRVRADFPEAYWIKIWGWYEAGGLQHVAAYLAQLDISSFDPKAPPPKTDAFWEIVDANSAPEESELMDALDLLKDPAAVTIVDIVNCFAASSDFKEWLQDRRNRRLIPYRFESCNYVPVRNPTNKKGQWVIDGVRQVIYAKNDLSVRERHEAVKDYLAKKAAEAANVARAKVAAEKAVAGMKA